jgi:dATP pyrophosphohydrolase
MNVWQFLSGGGESGESPMQAAKREANEEGGIPFDCEMVQLESISSIPASNFAAHKERGESVSDIPEYSFAVELKNKDLNLSSEHTELQWLECGEAATRLEWVSNKTALWELNKRITKG